MKFVRTTLDLAVQMQVCDYNPLHSFAFKKQKKKKKIFLNQAELQRLATYEFASPRLGKIAKLFVLQCLTGLAYCDLMRFNRSWINKGIDGRDWIYGDRTKVKSSQYAVPLFPLAKQLLEEFNYKIPNIGSVIFIRIHFLLIYQDCS